MGHSHVSHLQGGCLALFTQNTNLNLIIKDPQKGNYTLQGAMWRTRLTHHITRIQFSFVLTCRLQDIYENLSVSSLWQCSLSLCTKAALILRRGHCKNIASIFSNKSTVRATVLDADAPAQVVRCSALQAAPEKALLKDM